MTTKHAPATPLPWAADHEYVNGRDTSSVCMSVPDGTTYDQQKDNAAYIAHAANAYPRLVSFLRELLDGGVDIEQAEYLLRELGEL